MELVWDSQASTPQQEDNASNSESNTANFASGPGSLRLATAMKCSAFLKTLAS
jgi:hypothetical protein